MTPFLPEEIITNILKRLPVKSLIRFQCVCKHWKNLFRNPSFIADHLHHSSNHPPCILLQHEDEDETLRLCLLDCELQVREVQKAPLMDYFARDAIVFTSNGLVCVKLYKRGCSPPPLLVWNPATRDIRQVTKNINDFGDEFYVGFGFSPIVSDYKIVMFGFSNHAVSWVEVYSLTFGEWKEVECGSLVGITNLFDETVTINGVMFWLGLESKWEGLVAFTIVSFDTVMEMFTLIPMPVLDPIRQATLSVHDGRLAMLSIHMTQNFESQFIDLWVLEEAIGSLSGRWSWTKKVANGPFSYYLDPLTIWRNEIFCNVERQGEDASTTIALFNLTTNDFKMDFIDTCSFSHGAFNYVESLVPVGGTKFAVYM